MEIEREIKQEIKRLKELNKPHIHGRNILAKLKKWPSLSNSQRKQLQTVVREYKKWKDDNEKLVGYSKYILKRRVKLLNKYKNEIENVDFSAQSKFHSSVIEEFLYYLFKDLLDELNEKIDNNARNANKILLGGIRAYSNLYFAPKNLADFVRNANMKINEKDQDFAIHRSILIKADNEKREVNVPVVSIECKTYIDKTMLEGSIATAEKIKSGNPYCLFLVVTEWYDVSYEVDPAYSRIDQIYVLRKQKRKANKNNPINYTVVNDLFEFVKYHLERDWSNIEQKLTETGKIL